MIAAAGVALLDINQKKPVLPEPVQTESAPLAESISPAKPSEPAPPPSKQKPKPLITPLVPVQNPPPTPVVQPVNQPSRSIDLHTVVVLRCDFVNNAGRKKQAFGSGVIISSQGIILTARHVFDLEYAYEITGGNQGALGYKFEGCDVGQPPQGVSTPTASQIRAINPFTIVEVLPFRAEKFFVPSPTGWSPAEINFIDIGLLKISRINGDGSAFGLASLPAAFEFSPMMADEIPGDGEEIITFGFPSGNPQYGGRFFLQGSIGQTTATVVGDQKFNNEPIGIQALMETIGGRSGSPVFWRGYVIGVVSSKEDYSINSTSISVVPLMRVLGEAGVSF